MMIEDEILKNRKNNYSKSKLFLNIEFIFKLILPPLDIATSFSQRAEKHKLTLRKDHIESYIEKKRMKFIDEQLIIENIKDLNPETVLDMKDLNINRELSFDEIITKLKVLMMERDDWYTDTHCLRECVLNLRKITCRHLNRDNKILIDHKIHVLLFKILEYYQCYEEYNEIELVIIFEVLWAITNMVCISHSDIFREIKKSNFLSILKNYLYIGYDKLIDQAAQCIGNIVVESTDFRDSAIKLGILDRVVKLSQDITKPIGIIKNCMFLISNILRGKPHPQLEKIAPSLAIISSCLWSNDEEVVKISLWSISYLSDGFENIQSKIIQTNCVPKILQFAVMKRKEFQIPSLRILGNLAGGSNKLSDALFDQDVPKVLIDLLNSPQSPEIMKELMWIFNNFSMGSIKLINYLAENEKFIKNLKTFLSEDNDTLVYSSVAIFYNFSKFGNPTTIDKLINNGIAGKVCDLFIGNFEKLNPHTVMLSLGFVNKMITLVQNETKLLNLFNTNGIKDKLEYILLNTEFENISMEDLIEKLVEKINKFMEGNEENISMVSEW